MTPAQLMFKLSLDYALDHALLYTLIIFVAASIGDFYNKYWHINRNTDSIDLMERYTNYKLWSKYGRK